MERAETSIGGVRPSRRTLVRSTAWTVPAVAVATAAPAFATTRCVGVDFTFSDPDGSGSKGLFSITSTGTVPADTTMSISFSPHTGNFGWATVENNRTPTLLTSDPTEWETENGGGSRTYTLGAPLTTGPAAANVSFVNADYQSISYNAVVTITVPGCSPASWCLTFHPAEWGGPPTYTSVSCM